jgi:hypothetical protein
VTLLVVTPFPAETVAHGNSATRVTQVIKGVPTRTFISTISFFDHSKLGSIVCSYATDMHPSFTRVAENGFD